MSDKRIVRYYLPLTKNSLPELVDDYVQDISDEELASKIYPRVGYKVEHIDGHLTYVIDDNLSSSVGDGILTFETTIYKNRGSEEEEHSIKKYYFPLDNVRFWTELV